MKSTNKSQTSIAKFEEFFATSYKDDVFEILETYPDNRSLTVDYTTLDDGTIVGIEVYDEHRHIIDYKFEYKEIL